jgi:hypothetical protein
MDRLSGDQGYAAAFGGSATLRWLVEIAVWVLAGGQGKNHHNQDSSAAADPATASQGRPPHPGASSTEPGPRSVRAPRSRTAIGAPTVPKGSEEPQATLPPGQAAGRIRAGDADSGPEDYRTSRAALRCRRPGFVDGRGSRPAAGRTPRAGAGAPAASGSRCGCGRRGGRARRWRPPRGWWPGRRRAAPRTAPVAAPEPPNRENRQQFHVLLLARLPLGTIGGWVDRSWRPGPRVRRSDPGGTAALGATWGGGAYRTPCPQWRGSGPTAEPGPRSRFWAVPRTLARVSVPAAGARQR